MGLAAMMGALGILALIGFTPESAGTNLTAAFLSVYMVVFAVLLFLYELIWWQPFPHVNKMFRKNFGFMYGLKGKGFYLIFIAFLCLGLKDQNIGGVAGVKGLDWATGLAWLAVGAFHLFISFTWPEANECYRPPSAGFTETTPDPNVV
jgi:COPI associated protein